MVSSPCPTCCTNKDYVSRTRYRSCHHHTGSPVIARGTPRQRRSCLGGVTKVFNLLSITLDYLFGTWGIRHRKSHNLKTAHKVFATELLTWSYFQHHAKSSRDSSGRRWDRGPASWTPPRWVEDRVQSCSSCWKDKCCLKLIKIWIPSALLQECQ